MELRYIRYFLAFAEELHLVEQLPRYETTTRDAIHGCSARKAPLASKRSLQLRDLDTENIISSARRI